MGRSRCYRNITTRSTCIPSSKGKRCFWSKRIFPITVEGASLAPWGLPTRFAWTSQYVFFDVNQGMVKRVYEALISQEGSLWKIRFPSHRKGNKKTLQAMRGKREVIVSKILHPPQVLGRFLRSSVDPQYLSPFEVLGWSLRWFMFSLNPRSKPQLKRCKCLVTGHNFGCPPSQ